MANAKRRSEFHTPDGRIDADKAMGFVLQCLQTMTPEEFRAIVDSPTFGVVSTSPNPKKASPSSAPSRPQELPDAEPLEQLQNGK